MAPAHFAKPAIHVPLMIRLCFILLALVAPLIVADPDPPLDFCVHDFAQSVLSFAAKYPFTASTQQFVHSSLSMRGNTSASTVNATASFAIAYEFPGLNTLGIGMARLDFGPDGFIPPHTHTRGSEILFVMEGSLYAGFLDTNDVLSAQILNQGDVMIVPRGLIHFQLNVGKVPAAAIVALNSHDAAAFQVIAKSMFGCNIEGEYVEKSCMWSAGEKEKLKFIFSDI